MSYKIIADSCCDYTDFDGGMPWLTRVPLTIHVDGTSYRDTEELDCEALMEAMEKSPRGPSTSCPSPGDFLEAYRCGADEVYVVTMSEKVSGTYGSAKTAAQIYTSEGGGNIHVFNSKSAAAGQVALALKIRELAESGASFQQVVDGTEAFLKNISTFFCLETLEVLRKNGRLSHLQSIVAGALKIKMVMGTDDEGAIISKGKALSMERALGKLASAIRDRAQQVGAAGRRLVITHVGCPQRAAELLKALSPCGFAGSVICRSGGLSTTYANRGGVIVSF